MISVRSDSSLLITSPSPFLAEQHKVTTTLRHLGSGPLHYWYVSESSLESSSRGILIYHCPDL
mgnify:CR=1 FL=1|jgi:hypothetical protein